MEKLLELSKLKMDEYYRLFNHDIDDLIESAEVNYNRAEETALNHVASINLPVLNVPTLRDLTRSEFNELIKRGKQLFRGPLENSLFLVSVTDYITCAVSNIPFYGLFQNKHDIVRGIPSLLKKLNTLWLRKLVLLFPPFTSLSYEQVRNLTNLFENAVQRLSEPTHRELFANSKRAGQQLLQELLKRMGDDRDCFFFPTTEETTKKKHVLQKPTRKHVPDDLSDSLNPNEEPAFKKQRLSKKSVFKHCTEIVDSSLVTTTEKATKETKDTLSNLGGKRPLKKTPWSLLSISSKSKPVSETSMNAATIVEVSPKNILEPTSRENLLQQDIMRSVTPPGACELVKAAKADTPEQPVIINLTSPVKKKATLDKWLIPVSKSSIAKKDAFAIMMQRSKENSKRKSLAFN